MLPLSIEGLIFLSRVESLMEQEEDDEGRDTEDDEGRDTEDDKERYHWLFLPLFME